MNVKTTIYDLLGYFVPGFFFILLSIAVLFQFSKPPDILVTFKSLSELFNIYFAILLVIISYIFGFLLSSMGNIYYDYILKKIFPFFTRTINFEYLLENEAYINLQQKFKQTFNIGFSEDNFRLLVCFVENEKPILYSTALYYLSYYGMSRTLCFVFSAFSLLEIIFFILFSNFIFLICITLSLFLTILFLYQYIKFVKHFRIQIVFAFILS